MRREKNIDEASYQIYQDKVYLPFISSLLSEYDDWDRDINTLMENMTAVSWQDDDLP